jgi:hypothetical protein
MIFSENSFSARRVLRLRDELSNRFKTVFKYHPTADHGQDRLALQVPSIKGAIAAERLKFIRIYLIIHIRIDNRYVGGSTGL